MNVMITGAKGFLGRHLTRYLRDEHNILLTARAKNDTGTYYMDLSDAESVDSFIEKHRERSIDALVHTAGRLVDGNMSKEEQMQVFEDNIMITRNVVKLVQQLEIKVLVNCSSMAVYPNIDGMFDEESEIRMSCNSDCLYGLSKFCSENILDYYLLIQCRVIHLRLAQIYGDGLRNDRVIPAMKASIKEDNLIEVYGDGERVSNFIDVDNVCKVINKVLQNNNMNGIYNVGEKNLSYLELAKHLKQIYGNEDTRIVLRNIGSKAKFYLNTEKLEKNIIMEGRQ